MSGLSSLPSLPAQDHCHSLLLSFCTFLALGVTTVATAARRWSITLVISRLRYLVVRSGEYSVCNLMASTYARQTGASHTQIITEPATSPSTLVISLGCRSTLPLPPLLKTQSNLIAICKSSSVVCSFPLWLCRVIMKIFIGYWLQLT